MLAQIRKINEPIDRAQHVIGWHELVEAKFVKKTLLHHEPIAHHRRISLPPQIERITAKHWSRALFQRNPPGADIALLRRAPDSYSGQDWPLSGVATLSLLASFLTVRRRSGLNNSPSATE